MGSKKGHHEPTDDGSGTEQVVWNRDPIGYNPDLDFSEPGTTTSTGGIDFDNVPESNVDPEDPEIRLARFKAETNSISYVKRLVAALEDEFRVETEVDDEGLWLEVYLDDD